jgi:hypothetical protein
MVEQDRKALRGELGRGDRANGSATDLARMMVNE